MSRVSAKAPSSRRTRALTPSRAPTSWAPRFWSPDREIAECLELIAQANRRCDDALRQSEFAQSARKNLDARGEPSRGHAYERELGRVKRRFLVDRLVEGGLERAAHWGWPNIYTYTKAIGEQVIAGSGLPFAIARPAICESTVEFPFPAFNEGANTTAPFVYFIMKGQPLILAQDVTLDLIPSDYVVAGMIVALAELLEGTARPVYHLGTSDVNPCSAMLFGELVGLYKRKHFQRKAGGNPLLNALHARFEPTYVGRAVFDRFGPPAVASAARGMASLFRRIAPLRPAAAPLEGFARSQERIDQVLTMFEPFVTQVKGPFDCSNMRAAHARLSDADKAKLPWAPEAIDWADWTMNAHMPALEKRIIPEIDRRVSSPPRVIAAHETLVTLVDEMAQRHDMALALQRVTGDGLTRTTFGDVRVRLLSLAARLAALGVRRGDRVAISAENDLDWGIAFFGVVRAGATAVPVDAALDAGSWRNLLAESGALAVVWNENVAAAVEVAAAYPGLARLDLHEATQHDPALVAPDGLPEPADVAVLLEKGTGGRSPERVALTHANLTSLVAALSPIFPLSPGEAVLSFLPQHQPLELTRGLLLPFSRGARVVYAGQLTENGVAEVARKTRARLLPAGAEVPPEARECFARLGIALPDVKNERAPAKAAAPIVWALSQGHGLVKRYAVKRYP